MKCFGGFCGVTSFWVGCLLVVFSVTDGYGWDDSAGVTATRGTLENTVTVEWGPVSCATGYRVLKSDFYNGPYLLKGCFKKDERRFQDTDVKGGKYYWYKIVPEYWIFMGAPSGRVQGWVKPHMVGGMVDMISRIGNVLGQIPDFYSFRPLAEKRKKELPDPDISHLKIPDQERLFGWVENACATDHRRIGSPESKQAIAYIQGVLEEMPDMEVYLDPFDLEAVYTADKWGVTVETPAGTERLKAFYTVNTGMTLEEPYGETVSGRMIWAGDGSPDAFDALGDITGRVVVALCQFPDLPIGLIATLFDGGYGLSDPEGWMGLTRSTPMIFARSNFPAEHDGIPYPESVYHQAADRGAAGLVLVMANHPGNTYTHWGPYDGRMRRMPSFWVSSRQEAAVKALAEQEVEATLTLTGSVAPGPGHNIYAVLPGKSSETILISSHHDSCHKGATEDGTGISMVLAQADIWSRVPYEQREKTMVFVLTDGHHYRGVGASHFAETHMDDIMKKTIVNINLEHLAARGVEEDADGNFMPQDRSSFALIFVNESPTAAATASRMLERMTPALNRTMAIQSTLLGDVPPGEAGHFHIHAGTDFIHWIGCPPYLLTAEDTLDKVYKDLLVPAAESVTGMVATYMALPEGYKDYE